MKGVNIVTNHKGERIALMIDLNEHDKILEEYLNDLMDLVEIHSRRNEESIPWKEAKKKLKESGKID